MNVDPRYWNFPDRMGRIFLLAVDEILGQPERCRMLPGLTAPDEGSISKAPSGLTPEQIAHFHDELVRASGLRAGRGLSLRIGRASFKYLLQEMGSEIGLTGSTFHLLPSRKRIQAGLELMARAFSQRLAVQVRFDGLGGPWLWSVQACPFCSHPADGEASCDWMVGFLQEAMYWLSGGKIYQVAEDRCIASAGGECAVMKIDPTPIG